MIKKGRPSASTDAVTVCAFAANAHSPNSKPQLKIRLRFLFTIRDTSSSHFIETSPEKLRNLIPNRCCYRVKSEKSQTGIFKVKLLRIDEARARLILHKIRLLGNECSGGG